VLCVTETECVGLLKKDVWALVAKCVHIPVGHRNGVRGYRNEMWVGYRKRLFGLKKRNMSFLCGSKK
jgi:hypothetical protein